MHTLVITILSMFWKLVKEFRKKKKFSEKRNLGEVIIFIEKENNILNKPLKLRSNNSNGHIP